MRIPRDCRAKIKSMIDDRQIHHRLLGVLAISVILLVSTAIALITGVSLAFPGTFLDRIWALNRGAYIEFVTLGRPVGISLMILGLICAVAAAGLLKRRNGHGGLPSGYLSSMSPETPRGFLLVNR